MTRALLAFFLLLTGFAAGCAGTPIKPLEEPTVTLVNVTPAEMTLFEQRYDVTLRIQNPNNVALPVTGLKFDLALNGKNFARGVRNEKVQIPALGEITTDVAVTTTALGWLDQVTAMKNTESDAGLSYTLSGTIYLEGYLRSVPFSRHGTFAAATEN